MNQFQRLHSVDYGVAHFSFLRLVSSNSQYFILTKLNEFFSMFREAISFSIFLCNTPKWQWTVVHIWPGLDVNRVTFNFIYTYIGKGLKQLVCALSYVRRKTAFIAISRTRISVGVCGECMKGKCMVTALNGSFFFFFILKSLIRGLTLL